MSLTVSISNGMGGDGEVPSMLTEEKKVMPNDNSWKDEAIEHIKCAQECIKQHAQEDMKSADRYLDMAIDAIGGEPTNDNEATDQDVEEMAAASDKKKMGYEED